jgi:hypothetical protein
VNFWIIAVIFLVGALVVLLHLIGKRHNKREAAAEQAAKQIATGHMAFVPEGRTEFLGIQVSKNRPGSPNPLYVAVPTLRTDTVMMQAIPADSRPW